MRQFQRLLVELKDLISRHRPGEILHPPPSLPSIQFNGRRMTYAAMGLDHDPDAAQPIVLIHGFGGFFMDWPRVMAPLSKHTRVYAIDLPGWGFSEPNFEGRSLEDDVAAVRTFIETLDLKNVILCGISYGAGVTWAAAAERLPRVQRAVLLNPMPPFPLKYMRSPLYRSIFYLNSNKTVATIGHRYLQKPQYKLICKECLLNFRLLDSFYLDLAYLVIKQETVAFNLFMQARGAKYLDWAEWEHKLAGTRIPVTILQGREDKVFSMASARHLHRLIPTSQLIEVERCGHAMVFDQHKKVAEYLIQCLNKQDLSEGASEGRRGIL